MKVIHNIIFFLAVFFFLMIVKIGAAAEFEVNSFKKDESDLASRRFERKDINGEYCALIKIKTDIQGLNFQTSFGIVGDVLFKEGQYWIYISPREQRLSIFKTGFMRLDYEIPLPVNSYDVFHMKLSSKSQKANTIPVTFIVKPPNATLKVDGKLIKKDMPIELEVGNHHFIANKKNYKHLSKTVTVNTQNVLFRFEMEEINDVGVIIHSNPSGANITLDGVKLGKTPISTFYKPGQYPVRISKEGFLPIDNEYLTIKAPKTKTSYTLEENFGCLTVKTRPEANVTFNDKIVKGNHRIKVAPSIINVKITMPNAQTLRKSVLIKRNDDKTIVLMPDIQTGTIQVAPIPDDAEIQLISNENNVYNSKGMNIFKEIPVGTYQLTIRKDGYETFKDKITLSNNEKEILRPKLNIESRITKAREQQKTYSQQEEREPYSWWEYGINIGGFIPDNYSANFYNGEGDNDITRVLYNDRYDDEISAELGHYNYSLGELPQNMKYSVEVMPGLHVEYHRDSSMSYFVNFQYAKLRTSDVFRIDLEIQDETFDDYVLGDIYGSEERVYIDIGIRKIISIDEKSSVYLLGGLNINNTTVEENKIKIGRLTYSIKTNYRQNLTEPGYPEIEYDFKQGGIGFGVLFGGGAKFYFQDHVYVALDMTGYYNQTILPGKEHFGLQLVPLFRLGYQSERLF